MMTFDAEQRYKSQLISEAFELHHVEIPKSNVYSDEIQFGYRNKLEFSWYGDTDTTSGVDTLDLAFFRRGSKGKVIVDGSKLAHPNINTLARSIRDLLRTKPVTARNLKTLLIRSDQHGNCVWQLYIKDKITDLITPAEAAELPSQGGEVIFSNPKSPASVITERLESFGNTTLTDTILGTTFRYATEGFFQVNIPVYEQALQDMKSWIPVDRPTVDMYSGVGTIGLTIGSPDTVLVELNEHAVREMQRNIADLGRSATAVLAASEQALEHITSERTIILDPPRAGLHADVVARLLDQAPERIIYLSCNPATQARDVALLLEKYQITHTQGYNFFPRTPHIENLVILDRK
jgi:23S rRNA (uracil1939-C5)-methyltransferase